MTRYRRNHPRFLYLVPVQEAILQGPRPLGKQVNCEVRNLVLV